MEYINKEDLETIYCRKGCAECKNEMCLDEMLRGLPTIDIVHCSECKYWENGTMDLGLDCHTVPDHFCSDGERRCNTITWQYIVEKMEENAELKKKNARLVKAVKMYEELIRRIC